MVPVDEETRVIRGMFLIGCYTGLRRSDITTLKQREIIVKDGDWIIEKRMVKGGNIKVTKIRLNLSKLFSGKAIPILIEFLRPENDYVFGPQKNNTLRFCWKRFMGATGIQKRFTFHSSRHTCGYLLAKKTGSPVVVQRILHHAKIDMSMRYIHLANTEIDDILEKVKWD